MIEEWMGAVMVGQRSEFTVEKWTRHQPLQIPRR
jgi:hypothetical protein